MQVKQVKETIQGWVADNAHQYPDLCAAHLVGSINTMSDEAAFPDDSDVDFHLILGAGSPGPKVDGLYLNNLEFLHEGLMVEAGLKSVGEYREVEAVLANPEIAHHLTVDSILYDPQGWLAAMQSEVRQAYDQRRWVQARVAYERRGWEQVAAIYGTIPETAVLDRTLLMGYAFTYLSSLLCVATLQAPTMSLLKMREILAAYGRLDLYDANLAVFGLDKATPEITCQLLQEGIQAFDLAVQIRQSPHPFQHKLHAHLRPYFVNKCRRLLAAGYHREALGIILPFFVAPCSVIVADGSATQRAYYEKQADRFLLLLGINSAVAQQSKWVESRQLGEAIFALANEIVATRPDIVD